MVCKKCKEVLPDDAEVCTCCGAKIKHKKPKGKKKSSDDGKIQRMKGSLSAKIKIIATLAVAAVAVVIVIGQSFIDARNDSDIKVFYESKFSAVNNAMKFNYLVEDDDSVKVDGIKFPEWVVTICLNDSDEIVTVTYTDFTTCKKNHKGQKADKVINLDNVMKNEKYKNVEKEIDLDVYSITYENAFITYTYKYYYEDEAGNEQAVRLTVTYNVNMEYQYYSSVLVYPDDI